MIERGDCPRFPACAGLCRSRCGGGRFEDHRRSMTAPLFRLISETHHKPPVLRGLVDSDEEAAILRRDRRRDQCPSDRGARGEPPRSIAANWLFARRSRDLTLYGQSNINAAFTYTRPSWQPVQHWRARRVGTCAWDLATSAQEVGVSPHPRTGLHRPLRGRGTLLDAAGGLHRGLSPDLSRGERTRPLDPAPRAGAYSGRGSASPRIRDERGIVGLILPLRPCTRRAVASSPSIRDHQKSPPLGASLEACLARVRPSSRSRGCDVLCRPFGRLIRWSLKPHRVGVIGCSRRACHIARRRSCRKHSCRCVTASI